MRAFLLFITSIFIFSLQACIFTDNSSNEAIQLKLNLNPTHTYKYVKESKEVLQPEIKGTPITINQNMTIETSLQLTSDGKISFSLNNIAIRSDNGIISFEFDSKDLSKQGQDIFHNLPKVLNKQRTALLTNGTINVLPQNSPSDTSSDQGQLTDFSDSSIQVMLTQFFNFYPDQPVKLGDSWKNNSNVYIGFIKAQAENNYKLTAISSNIAHIEVNSNLVSQSVDTNGRHFKGIQTGDMDVDINSGLLLDCKLTRQIDGFMDNRVPTTIKSEIHITGKEK